MTDSMYINRKITPVGYFSAFQLKCYEFYSTLLEDLGKDNNMLLLIN